MFNYIIRRLLLMIPTLIGITAVVFFVTAMTPGGIGGAMLAAGGNVRGAERARILAYYEKRYHVHSPVIVQYGRWLNEISFIGWTLDDNGDFAHFGFKHPGFGESMEQHRPVGDLILEVVPVTLLLNCISLPLIYGMGILAGLRAARARGGIFDKWFGAAQLGTWSLPTIWVGVMLIGFLANKQYIEAFPTSGLSELKAARMTFLPDFHGTRGWLVDRLWHLVLPVFCLTYGGSAVLTKLVRGSVLENLSADYARTARAKGVKENVILYVHVFRNSLLSLITIAAAILPSLLVGSFIVETIFSIHGMGLLGVNAARYHDREVLLGVTFLSGVLTLLSGLVRDICYAIADPRVAYD